MKFRDYTILQEKGKVFHILHWQNLVFVLVIGEVNQRCSRDENRGFNWRRFGGRSCDGGSKVWEKEIGKLGRKMFQVTLWMSNSRCFISLEFRELEKKIGDFEKNVKNIRLLCVF